ncbi:MAG TPA: hypothetical protein VGO11_13400 [Chthoniobacteraceae bacterium]|jgi:hypothetical protein|nr:hypothetical protein [Chthoniobacteraceae bacterium]
MKQPANHLRYREEDLRLVSLAELSVRARISLAFIRLCIDCGCATEGGLLSQAGLLDWLFDHYPKVRLASGLVPFACVDGVAGDLQPKLRMANAILTILEFGESRSSKPEEKQQLQWIRKTIDASLDRA